MDHAPSFSHFLLSGTSAAEDSAYWGASTHQLVSEISEFVAVIEGEDDDPTSVGRKAIVFCNAVRLLFIFFLPSHMLPRVSND